MSPRNITHPAEVFVGRRAPGGGYPRVHLVYPNTYHVGMSSLALQAIYKAFVDAGCAVERVFMPQHGRWKTAESARPLSACDIVAFTVSFEGDYLSVINALLLEGLVEEQGARPLVLAGGAAVTINPEPLSPFFDLLCIGEAEEFIPELVSMLRGGAADIRRLAEIEGAYAPRLVSVDYDGPSVRCFRYEDGVPRPRRRYLKDLSRFPVFSQILSEETEFSSMFLAESGRGCENGCKFCSAGYLYRPIRKQKPEVLKALVAQGLTHAAKLGLVGAAVSSHPALLDVCRAAADAGARASLSSLMAYRMSAELGEQMERMGVRSVAIAPEAGSARLRFFIGKRVEDGVFMKAARELAVRGVTDLKLYFMIGLPGESDADIDAIADLSAAIAEAGPSLRCVLSVSPFIPKPNTPFQWKAMAEVKVLERRLARLRKAVRSNRSLRVNAESIRESEYQALLSRGDRRLGALMLDTIRAGGDWKQLVKAARSSVPPLEWVAHREWGSDEMLPWDVVDSRISKSLLLREADREYRPQRPRDCD